MPIEQFGLAAFQPRVMDASVDEKTEILMLRVASWYT